jgi:hypothetical protein
MTTAAIIAALVAGAPAQPAPGPTALAADRCQGPSPTLAAACPKCVDRAAIASPAAPWLEVRVLAAGDLSRPLSRANVVHHFLAARLPSGWWTCGLGQSGAVADTPVTSRSVGAPSVEDLLPGGGAELKVEVTSTTVSVERPQVEVRRLHLCGVGHSRAPSCTSLETYRFAGELAGSRDTPATFLKDGTIVLGGSADGNPGVEQRYRVVFP